MSTQPSIIGIGYTCPFCRQTFQQTNRMIIGEPKEQRIMRLAGELAGHLSQAHKDEFATIGASAGQIAGWMYTAPFKHNDADLRFFHEATRLQIRAATKRVHISDEDIVLQVGKLELHSNLENLLPIESIENLERAISKLLIGMRNALDEVPSKP